MSADVGVEVGVLGVVKLRLGGQPLVLGGTKQKAVLAVLALSVGRVVPVSTIVTALWGEDAPEKSVGTLQVYASALRRLIRDAGGPEIIGGGRGGYSLDLPAESVDAAAFERLLAAARDDRQNGNAEAAAAKLTAALELWRGPALGDITDVPFAQNEITRLEEMRLAATEHLLGLRIDAEDAASAVADLERLVAQYPLRENLWSLLMLGLYRSGRQADALAAYEQARLRLDEELGIEPSKQLQTLQLAILQHDESLTARTAPAAARIDLKATVRQAPSDLVPPAFLVGPGGERLSLPAGRTLLGRDPECDIVIPDDQASRRHAVIRADSARWVVMDLNSTNGTVVNDRSLEPNVSHALEDGDTIMLGQYALRFTVSG